MMRVAALVACLAANLFMPAAMAANTGAGTGTTAGKFEVGSKPANNGRGFSIFSSFANSTYRVECNCADFSLDVRVCNSTNYQCNCVPKAMLSC